MKPRASCATHPPPCFTTTHQAPCSQTHKVLWELGQEHWGQEHRAQALLYTPAVPPVSALSPTAGKGLGY